MKKTVEVTMTFEVELDIADEHLTPESIAEFESFMFDVDGSQDGIFKYVASQFADQSDPSFVEGIGKAEWEKTGYPDAEAAIKYQVRHLEVDAEVME
ncbi:hypothetical protein ACUXVY_22820 [Chromobacterium haemolyticum]|uniref:hypothetical protein n=1 Tax=Chromobacterium haemolyticum TaxID=394935 RepID=UPI0040561C82